jgi:hypothetical protein
MNMGEAIQLLQTTEERIGIRPKSWGEHVTKRRIFRTGVNGTSCFGMELFDPQWKTWVRTWSVFFPTWEEALEEWEVVPPENRPQPGIDMCSVLAPDDHDRLLELMNM